MEPTTEALLGGLLAASPDALLAVDECGLIVYANDQAERLFGWSKAQLVGGPVERLVPADIRDKHPELRAGYIADPMPRQLGAGLPLRACRKDGTEFPVEISLSTFATPSGSLVAAAIRDVTVARQAEQRLRAVLSAAPDAMLGVDAAGRIEIVNTQAERLFGWPADELTGQNVEVLVPIEHIEQHVRHRQGYVRSPEVRPMGAGLQLSARRRDGSTFPAEISLSSVTDAAGKMQVLAAVRDITDRIEMENERRRAALEAQREQSHRMESLGQLAGGIAHDFNNLLGLILNYAALLDRQLTDPTARADLAEIRAAADRGAVLTRQLLTFARRDQADLEPVDVADVVRGVAPMLRVTLGDDIELRIQAPPVPLVALTNRHQLEQILLNLALNARDAMPDGGVLTINAAGDARPEPWGAGIAIAVRDTGVGMPPEVLARAFEPFYTTKPPGKGTGLGLSTVYGIVRRSNGVVALESAVGEGTTVSIRLPGTDRAAHPIGTESERPRDGHERILLVEDEEPLRVTTARLLAEHGYQVMLAADGVEGLAAYDRDPDAIDLVLTDIAMPRMRGDEFAQLLSQRGSTVPVIFMSGYKFADAPLTGPLLAKPVTEDELLRSVREVLDV